MKVYKTLPDGIEIVEYDDSMAEAVADMWNKSGEGWGGSFDNGVYTAERVIHKRASGAFFNVYIAMKDGEALGYCSFDRYYKDADTAYVHLLNVRPDYHGKKIGRELVLMCVHETIARGMPRLDIHTWPGNTKAVPMYKKCGFFWEDRSDTTHLSNFIPTVLMAEPIKDFFETADWYADSTRHIDIKPDGKKVNKFDLYEYEWEKDGKHLRVGFEKTGRRINLIETDDYMIEMTAENHELAYGLRYPCKFVVRNKTGKELSVAIAGKDNDVISFNDAWGAAVSGEEIFDGSFFVNEIAEAQDDMRMHPCVLADVSINGRTTEFGLGIEPKFPITVSLGRKQRVAKPGVIEDVYINIKNGLSSDATIKFTLPENPLLSFQQSSFEVRLKNGKDTSVKTTARITDCGYSGTAVSCDIKLDSGEAITLSKPFHIVNQGVTGQFAFETEDEHGAANSLWKLKLLKKNNDVWFERIASSAFSHFSIPQLGKPYEEEFDLMKPADVKVTNNGAFIRLEAEFVSGKFTGAALTIIYEFDAAGTFNCHYRVANRGKTELDLSIKTQFWSNVGRRVVFPYDGGIHEVSDKMNYGFDTLDERKIDENWAFDASGGCPSGLYWPKQYKPSVKWGDLLVFEIPAGKLFPGQTFESEPFVYMCDVFKNFNDFRNFVLGVNVERTPYTHNHLELITNNGNPVVSAGSLELILRNNRFNIRGGCVAVSSQDDTFSGEMQTNPTDELRTENTFNVPVKSDRSGIGLVNYSFCLSSFEQDIRRAVFIPDDSMIMTDEKDGVFTVENGKLRFMASPGFSDAVYSLQYNDKEWFFSNYPSLESYAWWNPFVGGLKTHLTRMGCSLVLREKITAVFTSETDVLGNTWSGVRTDVYVENFDEYKGMHYSQYYLTLPGVPVMCYFTKVMNGSGRFMETELFSLLAVSGKEILPEITAELKEGDISCKVCLGGTEEMLRYDYLVKIARGGGDSRPEKLYVYRDGERDNGKQHFEYDINIATCDFNSKFSFEDGGSYTTMPIFCILSEKDLSCDDLEDLKKITF